MSGRVIAARNISVHSERLEEQHGHGAVFKKENICSTFHPPATPQPCQCLGAAIPWEMAPPGVLHDDL